MREQTRQKHFGPKPLAAIVRSIQILGKVVSSILWTAIRDDAAQPA
jgi:hypothetical protein